MNGVAFFVYQFIHVGKAAAFIARRDPRDCRPPCSINHPSTTQQVGVGQRRLARPRIEVVQDSKIGEIGAKIAIVAFADLPQRIARNGRINQPCLVSPPT